MTNTTKKRRTERMLLKKEFLRYIVVSLLALAIDTGLLLVLARLMHYLVAACIAFLAGSLVHYSLSVRMVFETRRLQHNMRAEGVVFVAAGAIGLLVNALTIYVGVAWLSLPLLAAKLLAAGGSFITGYLTRKTLLFS